MGKLGIFTLAFLLCGVGWSQEKSWKYKNENESLIEWDKLNVEEFLSFDQWYDAHKLKQKNPLFELNKRFMQRKEKMGRVLSCIDTCFIFRNGSMINSSYRSQIREGDEIKTTKEGMAWVFLYDGSMVRISPNSSITFREINVSDDSIFIFSRINQGHVYWLNRYAGQYKLEDKSETDTIFLPLRELPANPTSIREEEDTTKTKKQFARLNEFIKENNAWIEKKRSYNFIVLPNANIVGTKLDMDIFVDFSGASEFYQRQNSYRVELESQPQIKVFYRGYNNVKSDQVGFNQWYQMDDRGRNLSRYVPKDRAYSVLQLLTKRIPTILLAREYWLKKYSTFLYDKKLSERELSAQHGYRKWGNIKNSTSDMNQRLRYLHEYTRRIETTQILNVKKLKSKMERSGMELEKRDFVSFYQKAFTHYLQKAGSSSESRLDLARKTITNKFWKLRFAAGNP